MHWKLGLALAPIGDGWRGKGTRLVPLASVRQNCIKNGKHNTMKTLFLDLDGTVREPASGAKFINEPSDQRLIEGVREAIAHYREWTIIGITNQAGVAAGHKSLEIAILEQQITLDLVPQMLAIYFCPDFEGQTCWRISRNGDRREYGVGSQNLPKDDGPPPLFNFRKPGAGMVMQAIHDIYSYIPSARGNYWFVGDRDEDAQCAEAANINFVWADIWRYRFTRDIQEHRFSKIAKPNMSEEKIAKVTLLKFFET